MFSPSAPILVLFHGFGADAYDLQTLSDVWLRSGFSRFIFPQGFLEVGIGPGWTGRAWWPISARQFEEWQSSSQKRDLDLSVLVPEGLALARQKALQFLQALQLQNPQTPLVLGGFSQGAMLAMDAALHLETPPKALLVLSGQMLAREQWSLRQSQLKNMPVFISHGDADPVLPISGSHRLESFLRQAGARVKTHFFRGAHEIPPEVVGACFEFLQGVARST